MKGKKNIYTCEKCAGAFVTIDRDDGTTPFMTTCRATDGCNGMAQSSFYRVDQALTPAYEWRRLTDAEAAQMPAGSQHHHVMGGLFLRPIPRASERKHSKDILADELMKAGLGDMSLKARGGYYHDYLSPLPTPCLQLATDLKAAGTAPALALLERHMRGEFDATSEEADDWEHSADGQAALGQFPPEMRKLFQGKRH